MRGREKEGRKDASCTGAGWADESIGKASPMIVFVADCWIPLDPGEEGVTGLGDNEAK